jgi:hypothetical protein
MTEEQQIRAAAALAVFGQGKMPILRLSADDPTRLALTSEEELTAVEEYIRDGLG